MVSPAEVAPDAKPEKVAVKVAVNKPANGNNSNGMSEEEIDKWEKILSQVKAGVTVSHKSFGKGVVLGIKDNMKKIEVKFENVTKTFIFPDSFLKCFLKLENE